MISFALRELLVISPSGRVCDSLPLAPPALSFTVKFATTIHFVVCPLCRQWSAPLLSHSFDRSIDSSGAMQLFSIEAVWCHTSWFPLFRAELSRLG